MPFGVGDELGLLIVLLIWPCRGKKAVWLCAMIGKHTLQLSQTGGEHGPARS